MKRAEPSSYIRQTGIDDVRNLLSSFERLSQLPAEAMRMIDRTIGGLLAHPKSPFYHAYRIHISALFPAGLESTGPGRDIILLLNDSKVTVTQHGKEHILDIPVQLKNPEKRVAQIIGLTDARKLLKVRGEIISQLVQIDAAWKGNLTANNKAMDAIEGLCFSPRFFDKQALKTAMSISFEHSTKLVKRVEPSDECSLCVIS